MVICELEPKVSLDPGKLRLGPPRLDLALAAAPPNQPISGPYTERVSTPDNHTPTLVPR